MTSRRTCNGGKLLLLLIVLVVWNFGPPPVFAP